MSAPATNEQLAARAEEHQAILDELESLEYAPSALKSNEAAIASLQEDVNNANVEIQKLHKKTKSEHKDFAKLQNSAGRRMWVRIKHGGKQDAVQRKIEKEEREFLEALEQEQKAEESRNALNEQTQALIVQNPPLKTAAARHQELRTKLDLLYRSLFQGFTPDYPYEDEAEEWVRQAEDANANFQTIVNRETQVLSYLAKARTCLGNTETLLHQAQMWNYNDMFGGGVFSDMYENNALIDAKAYALRAQALVQEAKKKQPMVQDINAVNVAQLDFLVNIVFDNVFTDIMFADRIQASLRTVSWGMNRVIADLAASNTRLGTANTNMQQAAANLTHRRRELENIRKTILQSLHTHQPLPQIYTDGEPNEGPEEQLPAYTRVEDPKAKTPLSAASGPSTSASASGMLSPSSVYSAPTGPPPAQSSAARSRSRSPARPSRPVTPSAINPTNPYAGALLARARAEDVPDRTVSMLLRERRANAGVSAIPPPLSENRI